MANTAQGSQNRKPIKKIILVTGLILAIAIATIAIALAMRSDGTEELTGVKQDVAKKALSFERKHSSVSPMPSFTQQIQVDDVRAISADEKSKYCTNPAYISDNPNDPRYYAVVMSLHKLFEAEPKSATQYGCNFLQFDEGYLK